MDIDIEKLHTAILETAVDIHNLCKRYNIKYFMIAGSMLGAVRHKGFIPWDDDFDIGMLREDYEKFIKIAKTELADKYILQSPENDINSYVPFAKIRKKNTILVEKYSRRVQGEKGVYVDIFPFDNVPEKDIQRKIQAFRLKILYTFLAYKAGVTISEYGSYWERAIKKTFIPALSYLISRQQVVSLLRKWSQSYNNTETQNVVTLGGSYGYHREVVPKSWVQQPTNFDFANVQLNGIANYHLYLSRLYGDYMSPPPEKDRVLRHNIIEFTSSIR